MSRHKVSKIYRIGDQSNKPIEFLEGLNSDGTKWKMNINKAIQGMLDSKWEFFIVVDNMELNLFVINGEIKVTTLSIDFLDLKNFNI